MRHPRFFSQKAIALELYCNLTKTCQGGGGITLNRTTIALCRDCLASTRLIPRIPYTNTKQRKGARSDSCQASPLLYEDFI